MDESLPSPLVPDGVVRAIKFSIATSEEICTYSINDCPVSHPSQLTNPFLGLPLESGKCESCGTAELGKCEGHFGYIQLPVPVYHPSHISELKDILTLVCLKCMRMKKGKVKDKAGKSSISTTSCLSCLDLSPISIKVVKTSDGAFCLQLSVSSRTWRDGLWNFLDKYGFHHGDGTCRTLLPFEVLNILKEIPEETQKRLSAKGYFPQSGYILQYIPVPPNCLLVPEVSDGQILMSSDVSISLLKKVLNKAELIRRSRSCSPNFESHKVESNELQLAITEYMHLRGTAKAPHNFSRKFAFGKETSESSSKQWLEKMRTLFIRKGSGFSSRSVITGDSYIGLDEIGLPSEIAHKVTFEEKVTSHNLKRLQKMVDDRLVVTYRDGNSAYVIAVGSQGHTKLKVGQIINRTIGNGDIVFINRPPSTHKHSLQAFSVYIHDEHTVKINPLVCAPLGADFDGDCVHVFYPQSLAAKAEVRELFSVQQQLLSSHSGKLNLQLASDSFLALKVMENTLFLERATAQQLSMFVSPCMSPPAVFTAHGSGPLWTIHQILQVSFPAAIDCIGERFLISQSEILNLELNGDLLQSSLTDIIYSTLVTKGPGVALSFFNALQPLLMEILSLSGFSVNLKDFDAPRAYMRDVQSSVQGISGLLNQLRASHNGILELQVENQLKCLKMPIVAFILELSSLSYLIDSKSESSITKVFQQIGFLGLQLSDRGKLYSRELVQDIYSSFVSKYSISDVSTPSEAYGLVKSSLFNGLKPFEAFVHSINTREVIIRSSRGLTEPGTLFKNLMAILRDVTICYDGTVRNVCSNSLIQFAYGSDDGANSSSVSDAGEPVGVLAATAISTPAYKAVLDSSNSTVSSWELMKEILLCKSNYRNDNIDRRVILYLNDCFCGKKFCRENAALAVQNCLKRVTLKHCAINLSIEYQKQIRSPNGSGTVSGLVCHVHLDTMKLKIWNQNTDGIIRKCQEVIHGYTRKRGHLSSIFKRTFLLPSERCSSQQSNDGILTQLLCLQFSYRAGGDGETLEQQILIIANTICPILLDTIVKGDPRVDSVDIVWISLGATSWVSSSSRSLKGELALEVVVQKDHAKKNGEAWRTVLDACLPVMHLIDTTRSIPYGVQQLKESFGISCAFDQSVQRLSKCIKTVSKGMLKEHLLVVGNSMTCTGNLIGFNTGGFKALFRSLKIQVPFTEATLFTPMKRFDKAAEKCHTDSLGSVVSSCSWGKHVAVGTGSNFEVMWGQKHQVASNEDVGTEVYDLLAWVQETPDKELTVAGLGSDVDDLLDGFQNDEMPLSSEPNNVYEKPTFEDNTESECRDYSDSWQTQGSKAKHATDQSNKPSWEKVSQKSDNWKVHGSRDQPAVGINELPTSRPDVWSCWSNEKAQNENAGNPIWTANKPVVENSSGWHRNLETQKQKKPISRWKEQRRNNSSSMPRAPEADSSSGWGENTENKTWLSKFPDVRQNENAGNQAGTNWMVKKPEFRSSPGWNKNGGQTWAARKTELEKSPGNNGYPWAAKTPEGVTSTGWNQNKRKQGWKSQGWASSNFTVHRGQKNNSPRPPGKPDDRGGWRRAETFTIEEMILLDVEPIMNSIKKILRESSDGDRLSLEDQKFITENVFQYHPDKQSKVIGRIDYIMVDKHENFNGTRCFYIVSIDGSRADFSYRKCMENFIKDRYPEHADSFHRKYFRKSL